MRKNHERMYNAVVAKGNYGGDNTIISTENDTTKVWYYNSLIAFVDHKKKFGTFSNCGFNTRSTNDRIRAIKEACKTLNYKIC